MFNPILELDSMGKFLHDPPTKIRCYKAWVFRFRYFPVKTNENDTIWEIPGRDPLCNGSGGYLIHPHNHDDVLPYCKQTKIWY